MGDDDRRVRADDAWRGRRWQEVVSVLGDLDAEDGLAPAELRRLGQALYLVGRESDGRDVLGRAHRAHLDAGEPAAAVGCAAWLGLLLLQAGDHARASGWLARGERLAEDLPAGVVEHAWLRLPVALRALHAGDAATARDGFAAAATAGRAAGDPDLAALGLLGSGQVDVLDDALDHALTSLDEAMVAVVAGEVSPIVAGIVYCGVIATCRDTLDLRRAREWTDALAEWCDSQPDLVPYRGQCLVHRAQVLALSGRWGDALDEVVDARAAFAAADDRAAVGAAWYEQAELHRLRGEVDRAADAYERAGRAGHPTQPGMALLRLLRGEPGAAVRGLLGAVATASGRLGRARVLPAMVEAHLADGAVAEARLAADELADLSEVVQVEWVRAHAERARGAVLLAERRPMVALVHLRTACDAWRALDVPHEVARTRLLLARTFHATGDTDSARIEVEAVRRAAADLGAVPLGRAVDELGGPDDPATPGGLTRREVEVLAVVATGRTNRQVGEALSISDRTVGRHLGNIFTKLDLASRTAATAWAWEHGVVTRDD